MKELILLKHLIMELNYNDTNKIRVKFDGGCLKQDLGSLFHAGIVNVYIFDEISNKINTSDYSILENCLFGAVKRYIDKYGYSGYGIGFDRHGSFHFQALD